MAVFVKIVKGALFYPQVTSLSSDHSASQKVARHSLLFQLAVSRGPHILLHCTSLNTWFSLSMLRYK